MAEPDASTRSLRLQAAIARAWETMAEDYGLLPQLELDAALARADRGELDLAAPRLLELLIDETVAIEDAVAVAERMGRQDWSGEQRLIVEEVLDAWWLETLMKSPGEHRAPYSPDVVLGVLVSYGAPMIRWFEPWLAELDGPGASHLATMVIDGVDGPAWETKADEAGQILAWARTETVLNGLVLIGGTHLDDGVLGDLLDRLI